MGIDEDQVGGQQGCVGLGHEIARGENEPLRLRVTAEDLAIYRSEIKQSKSMEFISKPNKSFTDEDVDKAKRDTMKNHDFFGGEFDIHNLASRMAVHSGENGLDAFAGQDMNMDSVMDLAPVETDKKDEETENHEKNSEGGKPDKNGKDGSPKKDPPAFFDRDTLVPAAKRTFERGAELYKATSTKTAKELRQVVSEAEQVPDATKENVKGY